MGLVNKELSNRLQYTCYGIITSVVLMLVLLLPPSSDIYFQRYFGGFNEIFVIISTSIIGFIVLWALRLKYGFSIVKGRSTYRGVILSLALASILAAAIVIADFIIRYPQDINVPFPPAILFYPAIGFVVEIIFYILPLALLLFILDPLHKYLGKQKTVMGAILLVALIEPTFQAMFMGHGFKWGTVYTWIHIFIIALSQLYLFRKYDFMSMYFLRLFYYVYWHIIWGVIRLEVLF